MVPGSLPVDHGSSGVVQVGEIVLEKAELTHYYCGCAVHRPRKASVEGNVLYDSLQQKREPFITSCTALGRPSPLSTAPIHSQKGAASKQTSPTSTILLSRFRRNMHCIACIHDYPGLYSVLGKPFSRVCNSRWLFLACDALQGLTNVSAMPTVSNREAVFGSMRGISRVNQDLIHVSAGQYQALRRRFRAVLFFFC